jgi:hypothetical protein
MLQHQKIRNLLLSSTLLLLSSHILPFDDFFNEFNVVFIDLWTTIHHAGGAD